MKVRKLEIKQKAIVYYESARKNATSFFDKINVQQLIFFINFCFKQTLNFNDIPVKKIQMLTEVKKHIDTVLAYDGSSEHAAHV